LSEFVVGGGGLKGRHVEVADFELSTRQENVVRLYVAVKDRPGVEVPQAVHQAAQQLPYLVLAEVQGLPTMQFDEAAQVTLLCKLHDNDQ
jgi:hypothetical protein